MKNGHKYVYDAFSVKLHGLYGRHKTKDYIEKLSKNDTNVDSLIKTGRRAANFYIEQGRKEEYLKIIKKHLNPEYNSIITEADQICDGTLSHIHNNFPDFDGTISWDVDLINKVKWSSTYHTEINCTGEERVGDVRHLWELNRHQYFTTLGKAYWITGNEKYANELIHQITHWIDSNPIGFGVNWMHSQEVALRSVSWTWAYYFLQDYHGLDCKTKSTFLKSIYDHAHFIYYNLSRRIVTNNHLATEACGLAILGILYPEFKQSNKWIRIGLQLFEQEALKQVWEDGVSGELSTNYHCFILESFLQLIILTRKNQIEVSTDVVNRVEAMLEAFMCLMRPDGTIPLLGDTDNGRAWRLSAYSKKDRRAYLAIGAVLFKRNDFKTIAGQYHEEALWFLGPDSFQTFDDMPSELPFNNSRLFVPSGIATIRSSWEKQSEYVVFRGGPTAFRKNVSTGHNHADTLSFEFFTKGRPVLIDPGVYLYACDEEWRFYYRKSIAHNTIVVDDTDHFDVTSGLFGVNGISLSTLNDYKFCENYIFLDFHNNNYREIGINHRRVFVWRKDAYIIVFDMIDGDGSHNVKQCYHFSKELSLVKVSDNSFHAASKDDEDFFVDISSFGHSEVKGDLYAGSKTPPIGWASPSYGEQYPSPVVIYSVTDKLPVTMGTLLVSSGGQGWQRGPFERNESGCHVTMFAKDQTDHIVVGETVDVSLN